ncbi:MAG: tetratricopeptide repeat protein [Gemmatimonadales bacterium]
MWRQTRGRTWGPRRHSRFAARAAAALVVCGVPRTGSAQDLPLLTEYPGSEAFACPAWTVPEAAAPEAAQEARALASEANEALVLGELDRAEAFLGRALDLDGGSPELLYRRARVLEERGARGEAIDAFCRALAAGSGTEDVSDAQHRLDSLVALDRPTLSPTAVAAFDRGVSMAQAGRAAAAEAAFETAIREEPAWAPPVYNSALVSAERGNRDKAIERLRQYLELDPEAPNAVAVSRAIGRWEATPDSRLPDPGATLALGLFLPGTGQFYSGRPWPGVGVLAVAAGALATGFLVQEVRVRCVGAETSGSCPPGQVVGRETRRPHMGLALAVAAGVTVAGAIEAFLGARSAREGSPSMFASASNGDVILYSVRAP